MTRSKTTRCLMRVLLIFSAALCLGQDCTPPTDPPTVSACGLNATYCVAIIGKAPFALTAGDFDSDGDLDLVAANYGTDNIEVLLNDGQGAMAPAGKYRVGPSPLNITSGDWDGDGHLDVAVSDGRGVSILFNNGDATFGRTVSRSLDPDLIGFPTGVTTADLNGDGWPDLASPAAGSIIDLSANPPYANADHVAIMLNDGQGRFNVTQSLILGNDIPRLSNIDAGDLNGDGWPDLVIDQSTGKVTILRNDGTGVFSVARNLNAGTNHLLSDVRIADVNGDGAADVLVADNGDIFNTEDFGQALVYLNRGDGGFGSPMRLAAGWYPTSIAVTDLDGDGLLDLVVANNGSDNVSLFFNQANQTFQAARNLSVGDGPTCVVAADFNGDGVPDLAVSHMNSGTIGIYINDGTGDFTPDR
ncbi:MAG: VCBS repeat-containing protein [Phycisphaerae bacterium]|nr:VCBS repeat-containing protein [Phycisphaerae bacterium]